MRLGVLSDTHGLLRPEAIDALRGSDLILHAGDIGPPTLLEALGALAPVLAVRGNNDTAEWARALPLQRELEADGLRVAMVHDLATLDRAALDASVRLVVCGHSHRPRHEVVDGLPVLNPGSAGPRRFHLPVCIARVEVGRASLRVELVELQPAPRP